jgi:hypothetical protein
MNYHLRRLGVFAQSKGSNLTYRYLPPQLYENERLKSSVKNTFSLEGVDVFFGDGENTFLLPIKLVVLFYLA